MKILRKLLCWLLGHRWPWEEMKKPGHIYELMAGDFSCLRCGRKFRDIRSDLVVLRRLP